MSKRFLSITGILIAMLAVTGIGPAVPSSASQNQPQANCQTFKETGKTVCGAFLAYWNSHGGVTQQGFPISGEIKEVSDTNGKSYTVQYFERAVFEAHPENKAPYNVLLSLLGRIVYTQKYPKGAQELPPGPTAAITLGFPETGKEIGGAFMIYWQSHGGLSQFGYPITNLVSEKSDLDGKVYTVQYFERAVFEMHPENKPPYDVLLAQLGTYQYNKKYSKNPPPANSALQTGQWGGNGVSLKIDGQSISLEYDCAHSTIDGTAIPLDASGNFTVQGSYFFEHGGPLGGQSDSAEVPHSAIYKGTMSGNLLTLTVLVSNASPTTPTATGNQVLGPYTLTLNAQPNIHKCM